MIFFLKENLEIVAPGGIKGMEMKPCINSQHLKNSVLDPILLTSTTWYKKNSSFWAQFSFTVMCPLCFSPNGIFS